MAGFIKKILIGLLSIYTTRRFGGLLAFNSEGGIKCGSLNIQQCQARPTFVNINSRKTISYPFTDSVNMCGGSCNIIYDPYAQYMLQNMNRASVNVD